MHTGENTQALRQILDMTRGMAVLILLLHYYHNGYAIFADWQLRSAPSDRVLLILQSLGFFQRSIYAKGFALVLLLITLLGVKGKKEEQIYFSHIMFSLCAGGLLFLGTEYMQYDTSTATGLFLYIATCSLGFLLVIRGMLLLSRKFSHGWDGDVFNLENQTFPQQEKRLENPHSIHLPARYRLKNKWRKSWINIINPFRGLLVLGTPGSGKTYFIIQRIIRQHIQKDSSLFVYDFKAPDLSRIAYQAWQDKYPGRQGAACYFIRFDDLDHTHRCNPLHPRYLSHISDAAESARTILLGLNREWIPRQGAFFVESPINFLTAIIWYLRRYKNGRYCTLPHVLELMQIEYSTLFSILNDDEQISLLINPFITAYVNKAMEQLEGQLASAKIAMARLASPELYYVLSGDEFTLDINDPNHPKLVCMGNDPQRIQTYGAVLSLYINRMIQCVNQKGKRKSALIFDEFPTVYLKDVDHLLATARENQVAVTLGLQDISQLRKAYGREQADVILNVAGNLISGQVNGDGARWISERVGRILQERKSISVNHMDVSFSRSRNMEPALPPSRVANLSSGEFVGSLADQAEQSLDLKVFHARILPQKQARRPLVSLPKIRHITQSQVEQQFSKIREEVDTLVKEELTRIDSMEGGTLKQ